MQTITRNVTALGALGVLMLACGGGAARPSAPPEAPAAMTPTASAVATSAPAMGAGGVSSAVGAASTGHAMGASEVAGGSDRGPAEIGAVVRGHHEGFRACYEQAHSRDAKAQGSFVIDFTLNPDGSVKEASYAKDKSEIKDDAMGICAMATLRSLLFPASKRGMESKVSYPFLFRPGGGSK